LARFISGNRLDFFIRAGRLWLSVGHPQTPRFLCWLGFLGGRFVFGCGNSGADAFFSESVAVLISFLLTGFAARSFLQRLALDRVSPTSGPGQLVRGRFALL
jgi:hypothetical protein